MADVFMWFIRFLHIFSGVMWIGGAFLWGMIIAPNVLKRGPPPIRRPFLEAVLARFTRYMMIGSVLTILTGFWVMGLIVGFANISETFQTGEYGIALGIGTLAALVMAVEGFAIIAPTGKRMLQTMQTIPVPAPGAPPTPPSAEVQAQLAALGKKLGIASMTTLFLGTLALGAMAWAVNVQRLGG